MKQILLETYQGEDKVLDYINSIPNSKVKTINGKSELLEKTNIKLVSPIVYKVKINALDFEIWSYQNKEVINKSYYLPILKRACNFDNLKKLIENEIIVL